MMTENLFRYSATELAELIRSKKISSEELVRLYIQEIKRWNPTLNAMIADRFEEAIEEAVEADKALAKGEDLPFLGVPCTIKEAFAVLGMPNTSGLVSRKDFRNKEDAETVRLLRAAGFIPLGVSNTSELCMWMESSNKLYGQTNNPYDLSRTVGGSSGGEGALIGAGLSPVGLGSDIGGSIRMPAFFNGIFGHKCSSGLISNEGQFPQAENEAQTYLCSGPLCRKAEDLFPLIKLLAGEKGLLLEEETIDWSSLKVISIPSDGLIPVSKELRSIQKDVLRFCAEKGADTMEITVPGLKNSLQIWLGMMEKAAETTFAQQLFEGSEGGFMKWWLALLLGRSPHTIPALVLASIETVSGHFPSGMSRFVKDGHKLQEYFSELLDGNTLLLYPSHGMVAPKHSRSLFAPWRWAYTAIINSLLLPATQVPLGLNEKGLPLGVQVIGKHGHDAKTIAMAVELEKEFGGWTPPDLSVL